MSKTESSKGQQHIGVLAFPFGSHVQPLLNLISKLTGLTQNLQFSVFLTQKSAPNSKLPDNIKFFFLPDGVPVNHVFSGNPVERVEFFLKSAPENIRKGIELAVAETGRKVSCLIADSFLTFVGVLAKEMDVPWIAFWVSVPYTLSTHFHSDLIHQFLAKNEARPENQTLDFIPGLSAMRLADIPGEILQGISGESLFAGMVNQFGQVLPEAAAIVVQFFHELDQTQTTNDLKSKLHYVCYVGSLSIQFPPPPLPVSESDSTGCLLWLDGQNPKSVLYISFGTVAKLPQSEILELAEALEMSKIPFIWSMKDDCKEKLPNGFFEKTKNQGKIVSWAPQAQILGHPSMGVFLSHGGTNSVLEALANEVPLICRPFFGDHMMNAQMVVALWGIGVRFESNVITKSHVIKSLELILYNEEGKKMREKIQGLKRATLTAIEPNGSVTKDFKTLVDVLSKFLMS